ncbi:MAG: S1C family serine protease [Bacteroidota bacterium]
MNKVLTTIIVLLLPFLGGGLIGYNIGHASKSANDQEQPASQESQEPSIEANPVGYTPQQRDSVAERVTVSRRNAITKTVAAVSPAVVGINVIELRTYRQVTPWGDDPFFRQFFGDRTYTRQVPNLGSGVIISPDGYILTNDHVAGNAKEITVTMTNGEKHKAEIVGTDLVSDIALLKISGTNLPHVMLGNSDDVIIGEWVVAFGNPFGLFDISDKPTVTVGVVSATDMNLRGEQGRVYRGMIQTDAAINSGNSGGPLVNSIGEVIGVNAVIYTPNQGSIGLGFAIPINRVKSIVAELKRSGKIEREYWTGLEVQAVDGRIARYFGLDKAEGVIISDVKRGSPAERSGFRVGDIVLTVNGERILDDQTIIAIVNDHKVGDVLNVRVMRERVSLDLELKLEKRPT